jgi:hypothetical protein
MVTSTTADAAACNRGIGSRQPFARNPPAGADGWRARCRPTRLSPSWHVIADPRRDRCKPGDGHNPLRMLTLHFANRQETLADLLTTALGRE